MEKLTPRQIGQRIRRGALPAFSKSGKVYCSDCNADHGDTEALRFWSKGDRLYCGCGEPSVLHLPRVVHPALGIEIDVA